eukprot:480659-Amphidinium_carterae.1
MGALPICRKQLLPRTGRAQHIKRPYSLILQQNTSHDHQRQTTFTPKSQQHSTAQHIIPSNTDNCTRYTVLRAARKCCTSFHERGRQTTTTLHTLDT